MSRLLSSPAVRCVQTLQPAARTIGRAIEPVAALAEGHPGAAALALIEGLTEVTAICSHGDVIDEVLERLAHRGLIETDQLRAAKGSVWELTVQAGTVIAARYREPDRGRGARPAG